MTKRLFDLLVAGTALAVLSPLFLLIAVAVKLDSAGPALFRQVRVGRDGEPFEILKFRSMRHSPGELRAGPLITPSTDPRVTRVGIILRRTKLDELPQLYNVLKGDMSIVGPRPEVPRYVAMYPLEARKEILSVRPGITDEASVEFSNEGNLLAKASDPEQAYVAEILPRKIEAYREYVRTHSLSGDLRIIGRTLLRVFLAPS